MGDIWYLNTSKPPIISLRLPEKLIHGHGEGEGVATCEPLDLGDPIDRSVCVINPRDFRRLITKQGFGSIYWNRAHGNDAFATLEVLDGELIADFNKAGNVATV
jgi:hypothetical protein